MSRSNTEFLVNKNDFFTTTFLDSEKPIAKKNEVLLKIEKYAFTSNNITYAIMGKTLNYWNFFPTKESNGIIPVWGFAYVVSSNHKNILVGDRYYGYFPMSNYLKVIPKNIKFFGFVDGSKHRKDLPAVYNLYTKVSKKFDQILEYHPTIKPLFLTSFLNYYYLRDENFFDSDQIILTSASSKTALSLAFLLKKNKVLDQKKVIGITSENNIDFLLNIGFYDKVISYDSLESERNKSKVIVIDFAGNSDYLKKIHNYFGDLLKHVCLIGLADWSSKMDFKLIPNSKFFFAPSHAESRYKKMGVKETMLLADNIMNEFIVKIKDYLKLTYVEDRMELNELYLNFLNGKIDPSKAYIVQSVK